MKLSYDRTKGETCPPEEFIQKAQKIHDFKYDYSESIYVNSTVKIKIKCHQHGNFYMTPNNHLRKRGCARCAWEKLRAERQKPNQFIEKAKRLHKNKYDYSKVKYINCDFKVEIICPIHGPFFQNPYVHLNMKCGCPECGHPFSRAENEFLSYLKIPDDINHRQVMIFRKIVDGYIPEEKTIYEFLGDYWHGNPENPKSRKNRASLYEKTMERLSYLKSLGYKVFYIWENDWKKFKRGIDKLPKIQNV